MTDKQQARKPVLPIILLTIFIDLLGSSIVIPVLAPLLALPFQSALLPNTSYSDRLIIYGFLVASYSIAQFFFAPILGQLADRFGRKPILAISLIGTLVARVMFIVGILTVNVPLMFISRIVDGITGGNISVAQSAIADITTPENKAKNFGLIGAAFGLGFVIGPYIGGKLGEDAIVTFAGKFLPDWIARSSTLPLWFATLLCALDIVFLFLVLPETIKEKILKPLKVTTAVTNVVKAFTLPNLRIVFVALFFMFLGFNFFTQFLSVYIGGKYSTEISSAVTEKIKSGELKVTYPKRILEIPVAPAKDAAMKKFDEEYFKIQVQAETQKRTADLFSYIGIWVVIAQAVLARLLAKKFSSSQLLKLGLFIMVPSILLLILPNELKWLYFIFPIIALANGLTQANSTAIVSNSADAKSQGEVLGVNASVQALAMAVPPIINGFITSVSLELPIYAAAGCTLIAFAILIVLYKDKKKVVLHEE